ncbi:uncharacterized protein [Euphorbia lathyris]|uniref:uncharacterized protein n=1 Tax=Euphorbia lathyris TaxID=212925 RepID=UPI003314190C
MGWSEEMMVAKSGCYKRILMESNYSWHWYLGERIRNWTKGPIERDVPPPPPGDMFWVSDCLSRRDVVALRRGEIFLSPGGPYSQFIQQLLPRIPTPLCESSSEAHITTRKQRRGPYVPFIHQLIPRIPTPLCESSSEAHSTERSIPEAFSHIGSGQGAAAGGICGRMTTPIEPYVTLFSQEGVPYTHYFQTNPTFRMDCDPSDTAYIPVEQSTYMAGLIQTIKADFSLHSYEFSKALTESQRRVTDLEEQLVHRSTHVDDDKDGDNGHDDARDIDGEATP